MIDITSATIAIKQNTLQLVLTAEAHFVINHPLKYFLPSPLIIKLIAVK